MNSHYTILIIEDDKLICKALEEKLAKEGFVVKVAGDGEEGITKAFSAHPDLILLDLVLPKLDGITLLGKLRDDEWGKNVPVVILSNLTNAQALEESKKQGVFNYLVKTDWKLEEVVAKIREELKLS